MDRKTIEKGLLRESKAKLAELLSDVIWLSTYDRNKRNEYEAGWVDSRISILELTGLGRFVKKED